MRILIVGGGSIGERHLRTFLSAGAEAEMCESVKDRREMLAGKYGVTTHPDWMAIDLSQFAAVVVCTPAPLHIPMATRAVESDCHVLIEKPLSLNPHAEIPPLLKEIEKRKKMAGVAHIYRHMPGIEALKAQLDAEVIGKVRYVTCVGGQDFPAYRPGYRETYYVQHKSGGGTVFDAAVHFVDAIQWIAGPISHVYCNAEHQAIPDSETEDVATMALRFGSGITGLLSVNQTQANNETALQIVGEKGTLSYRLPSHEVSLCVGDGKTGEEWTRTLYPTERDDAFVAQAKTFLEACRGEGQVRCSIEDGARAASVCVAAHRSVGSRSEERVLDI